MITLFKWAGAILLGCICFIPMLIAKEIPQPPIEVIRELEGHKLDHFEVEKKTGLQALELLWKEVGIEFSAYSSVVFRNEKTRYSSKELGGLYKTIDLHLNDKTGWEIFLAILKTSDWHYKFRVEGFLEICMWKGENFADWSSEDDVKTKEAFEAVLIKEISVPDDLRLAIFQLGNAIRKSQKDFRYDIFLDVDFIYYRPDDLSRSLTLLDVGKLQNVSADTVVKIISAASSFRIIWRSDGVHFISR